MDKQKKSRSGNFGLKTFPNSRSRKAFFHHYCTQANGSNQCKKCRSDYMRASVDGMCQACLQKAEFIVRERPDIVALAGKGGQNVVKR